MAADLGNLATLLGKQGDFDGAEPMFAEGVRILRAALGPEHQMTRNYERCLQMLRRAGCRARAEN